MGRSLLDRVALAKVAELLRAGQHEEARILVERMLATSQADCGLPRRRPPRMVLIGATLLLAVAVAMLRESPAAPALTASVADATVPRARVEGGRPDRWRRSVAVVGDILPVGVASPLAAVSAHLHAADLVLGNLECPLSDRGAPSPGKMIGKGLAYNEFVFRAPPSTARDLADGGLTVASLANNHAMDYGTVALADTVDALGSWGILAPGATARPARRVCPTFVDAGGMKVAILAYVAADTLPPAARHPASPERAGLAFVGESAAKRPSFETLTLLREDIESSRLAADVVLVAFHWGQELSEHPSPFQRSLGQRAIEYGADAVIGSHPHVLQGVELHEGRPILYSLGNFVFASGSPLAQPSAVGWLIVEPGGVSQVSFRPISLRGGRPILARGAEARDTVAKLAALSGELGTRVLAETVGDYTAARMFLLPRAPAPELLDGPVNGFVDVTAAIPGVVVSLPYATTKNRFGQAVYASGTALLRRGTAQKLACAQTALMAKGLRIKVLDAFRPESVQRRLWSLLPDPNYVADPRVGSDHSRGAAVDVTLLDSHCRELPMPTEFDAATAGAGQVTPGSPADRLRQAMAAAGFAPLATEWWHFADTQARRYPLTEQPSQPAAPAALPLVHP